MAIYSSNVAFLINSKANTLNSAEDPHYLELKQTMSRQYSNKLS